MINAPSVANIRPTSARSSAPVREREILRFAARLGGSDARVAAASARSEILKWTEERSAGPLPLAAWDYGEFEHLAGGRNCSAVRIVKDSRDIWALRADDPDKNVAQRVWTTEATVAYDAGATALFSLRLLVNSPEPELDIQPAVPRLVTQLVAACGLYQEERQLITEPWIINSDLDTRYLIDMLVNPMRTKPCIVFTSVENSVNKFGCLLDPGPMARAMVGLASVIVMPSHITWMLTERFGKKLSVFGGAVRVYLPGFAEDANPYAGHDLILADSLLREENIPLISAKLRRIAANESLRQFRLGSDVLAFSAVREGSLDFERERLRREGATEAKQLTAAHLQIEALKDDLRRAKEEQKWLLDEQKLAEDRAKTAEEQLNSASFRIEQLLNQFKQRGQTPDMNIGLPNQWSEFGEWCEQNFVGRIVLSPRARREIKAPHFRDVGVAAECILWLANDYRDRRLNGGDGDLRISIKKGIQNDRCGSDGFRMEWRGQFFDVDWHIKNGGNTRDPSRCLRIYYFWDQENRQIIIASMPAHIWTDAS